MFSVFFHANLKSGHPDLAPVQPEMLAEIDQNILQKSPSSKLE
jgi:hypothetical protein